MLHSRSVGPTSASWRSADANAVGMQASRLNGLAETIAFATHPGINSLIIVRHGYLVTERYFNGTSAATSQTVQSVTKSVTSLLAGIAVDKGLLTSNGRALNVLPEYGSLAMAGARKRRDYPAASPPHSADTSPTMDCSGGSCRLMEPVRAAVGMTPSGWRRGTSTTGSSSCPDTILLWLSPEATIVRSVLR